MKRKSFPPVKKSYEDFERPIPEDIYPALDNDLARDNLENDIPDADLNDLSSPDLL